MHLDALDMADCAGAYQFDGPLELPVGTLLATHLQHPVVRTYGTYQGDALRNRIGQRLLQIDILRCLTSMDGCQYMPMVRCSDGYDIDIFPLQYLFIKFVGVATGILTGLLLPFRHPFHETFSLQGILRFFS